MDDKRENRGFTLIELLVVISIIALLMSILMPSLKKANEAVKRVLCANNVRQYGIGAYMYAEDNRSILHKNNRNAPETIYWWSTPGGYSPGDFDLRNAHEPYLKDLKVMMCAEMYSKGVQPVDHPDIGTGGSSVIRSFGTLSYWPGMTSPAFDGAGTPVKIANATRASERAMIQDMAQFYTPPGGGPFPALYVNHPSPKGQFNMKYSFTLYRRMDYLPYDHMGCHALYKTVQIFGADPLGCTGVSIAFFDGHGEWIRSRKLVEVGKLSGPLPNMSYSVMP